MAWSPVDHTGGEKGQRYDKSWDFIGGNPRPTRAIQCIHCTLHKYHVKTNTSILLFIVSCFFQRQVERTTSQRERGRDAQQRSTPAFSWKSGTYVPRQDDTFSIASRCESGSRVFLRDGSSKGFMSFSTIYALWFIHTVAAKDPTKPDPGLILRLL